MNQEPTKFSYYLPEYGQTPGDAEHLESYNILPVSWQEMAEHAADHDHAFCDGWDHEWPTVIAVVCNGEERWFKVEREYDPSFYAREMMGSPP